ncbi:hypothetical protein GDO86_001885 [Hymenochirus boettgeri]|uniref:Gamma-glutamyltransferase 5 n=1 Tax=Hymenochirus boettgeri TaxID=247094 RepID=A0A8T2KKI0_9PIPI|nr:hypothetical protein GDO86_001885 [Hymenochirus boettgeri]
MFGGWSSIWAFLILLILSVGVSVMVVLFKKQKNGCEGGFLHGAVAADSLVCSKIGKDILKDGGSPVDAAIAALLCTSVINPQSMGLGGGVIFTIYNASTGLVEVINARETVPNNSSLDLAKCETNFFKTGVQWIGVPGELRGYEAAHNRHGRLPWKSLFEPTIKLITEGVKVTPITNKFLKLPKIVELIKENTVCKLLCKGQDVLKEGQFVNFTQLGHTLNTVAQNGADSFYHGIIAEQMLEDLSSQGSTLTMDDLRNYKVHIRGALNVSLGSHNLYSVPQPIGGVLLSFILKVLEGYNFSESSIEDEGTQIETYHLIAEVMKFANGLKNMLGKPQTEKKMEEVTKFLLSKSFTQQIRNQIDGYGNHSFQYYNTVPQPETFGTSHVAVIGQDGSSVSATSSINFMFGSMVYSPRTGIIFNNQLGDFCNYGTHMNSGQRPPSSMAPSILLSNKKNFQLVIGASGGSHITSAIALSIINKVWFGENLKKAIKDPKMHVTADNQLVFESLFSMEVQKGLQRRGHQISNSSMFYGVVQGVSQEETCLFAHSDHRKMGEAAGY